MISIATQEFIRELRLKSNLKMQDIANLLGVSKTAVSKWETSDDLYIKTEMLYKLSKLYGVTVRELLNGKFDSESDLDFLKRNYDLSRYEFDVKKKDFDIEAKDYYKHCNMIKIKFIELLPKWAYNNLSNGEIDEFDYIKMYFEFDKGYYSYIKYGSNYLSFPNERDEKEFVKELIDNNKELKDYDLKWLLMKPYNFKCDIHIKEVLESKNFKAIEYMLSSLSKIQKNY